MGADHVLAVASDHVRQEARRQGVGRRLPVGVGVLDLPVGVRAAAAFDGVHGWGVPVEVEVVQALRVGGGSELAVADRAGDARDRGQDLVGGVQFTADHGGGGVVLVAAVDRGVGDLAPAQD